MSNANAILQLSPQEELSSLLARIGNNQAVHITLAVPEKSVVAQGVIGLQLLADEAHKMGKKLTISSDSPQIQRMARRVGLEAAGSATGLPEHGFVAGGDVAEMGLTDESSKGIAASSMEMRAATAGVGLAEADRLAHIESRVSQQPPVPSPEPRVPSSGNGLPRNASLSPRNSILAGVLAHLQGHGWKWAVGVAAIGLLFVGGTVYAMDYYLPQATVTVYAAKQTLDRDVNVTVDPQATAANVNTLTVPGKAVTATASKSQSFDATGSKDVGTKASGSVTIFNKTDTDKTLAAGTVLTANNLQFLLDKAVTVPAATTDTSIDPVTLKMTKSTTPGTVDGSVTAADMGDKYNIDAKSSFAVAKFDVSSFSGRNDAAFTGGSKKTVKIVTATDQSQALDSLSQTVQDQATKALTNKVPSGMDLLTDGVKTQVTTKNFSQKVGDQADTFNLTLEVTATGLAVDPADIKSMLNTDIGQKVPEGYTLDTKDSTTENHVTSTDDDGTVHLTSTYKAEVVPQVDTEEMKKAIAGKNPTVVQDYLKNQPNLKGYDITLKPKLPGPFYHLPALQSHIKIVVEVK